MQEGSEMEQKGKRKHQQFNVTLEFPENDKEKNDKEINIIKSIMIKETIKQIRGVQFA